MPRIKIQPLILSALKRYCDAFVPAKYSYTAPSKFFLDWLFKEHKLSVRQKYHASKILRALMSKRIIRFDEIQGYSLSKSGVKIAANYELENFNLEKPFKWDEKYRVIAFDIKEELRKTRDRLRRKLRSLGFIQLQQSIWVYPYDCQEILTLIRTSFGVMEDALYMTVDSIENDEWLKKEFGLI